MKGDLPKQFNQVVVDAVIGADTKGETVASRKASQLALEAFTAALPELLGGSAVCHPQRHRHGVGLQNRRQSA